VRPDHQHHLADRGQEGQGLRGHHLKRLTTPALKDLPTLQESGLKDFEVTIWHGLYAPKGTPPDVLKKLNDALKVALKDPEFIKKQEGLGAVVVTDKRSDPAEHKKFVSRRDRQVEPDHQGRRRLRRLICRRCCR
jgi:tripartite-type tricarboxylate transporter receptor subunit TctC